MAAGKFTVPTWAQKAIIAAAGVDPNKVSVSNDCETHISFTEHRARPLKRRDYVVDKITGQVLMSEQDGTLNWQAVKEGVKKW